MTAGIAAGAAVATTAHACGDVSASQAAAIFVVGALAGLLPDLDSDTGKPLGFLFQIISVLIPVFTLHRLIGGSTF